MRKTLTALFIAAALPTFAMAAPAANDLPPPPMEGGHMMGQHGPRHGGPMKELDLTREQRQQQAEQGQHHQCDAQRAERPEQAAAVPGLQLRVRDAVDEQIGMVALRADVFLAQLAPGEARQVAVAGANACKA